MRITWIAARGFSISLDFGRAERVVCEPLFSESREQRKTGWNVIGDDVWVGRGGQSGGAAVR